MVQEVRFESPWGQYFAYQMQAFEAGQLILCIPATFILNIAGFCPFTIILQADFLTISLCNTIFMGYYIPLFSGGNLE